MELCLYSRRSFTLIELLITVSILTILAATMLPQFIGYSNERNAERATAVFTSDLQLARNKALSGAAQVNAGVLQSTSWGVRITCYGNSYELGYYNSSTSTFSPITSKTIPGYFQFMSSGNPGDICSVAGTPLLLFERLTGQMTPDYAEVEIVSSKNAAQTRTVKIYKSGSFEIQ